MRLGTGGIIKVAGALALAGSALAAAAPPAAAAGPTSRAYAASATGPLSHSPIGEASYPGTGHVKLRLVHISHLFRASPVDDRAGRADGKFYASANVMDASASTYGLELSAKRVESSCSSGLRSGDIHGSSALEGHIDTDGVRILLPHDPSPNTQYGFERFGSVILNKQTTAADGTLTVTGIYMSWPSGQTLSIAVTECSKLG